MKNIDELGGLMVELIEAVEEASKGGEELIFTPRAVEIAAAIGIPPEKYRGSWLYYMENHVPAERFGAVIGTATIGRVLTSSEAIKVISPKERALGDYSPRRYAWELTDVEMFKKPIPARGQQGLWEWDGYGEAAK